MKKAFTMIELIFVIVIIGILAAIAIPKLTGTRTDAKISAEMANAKIALTNLGAEFTTRDAFVEYTKADANEAVKCFRFDTEDDGNVTIEMIAIADAECPDDVYDSVRKLATNNMLTSTGGSRTYAFGGNSIKK